MKSLEAGSHELGLKLLYDKLVLQVSQSDAVCHCLTTCLNGTDLPTQENSNAPRALSPGVTWGPFVSAQKKKEPQRRFSARVSSPMQKYDFSFALIETRFACDLKAPCEISKVLKHVSAIFHRL